MTTVTMMGKTYKPTKAKPQPRPELKSHIEGTNHILGIKQALIDIQDRDLLIYRNENRLTGNEWEDADIAEKIREYELEIMQAAGDINAHLHYMTQDEVNKAGFQVSRAVWDRVDYTCPGIMTGHWQMLEGSRTGE